MKPFLILVFVLTLILSACSPASTTPTIVSNPTLAPQDNGPYPPPGQIESAYPVEVPTFVEEEVLPTRDPSLAMVTGRLLLNGNPVTDGIIYLSEIVRDDQQNELAVALDRTSKLSGVLDENGRFIIMNVPAGKYGFVYDLISEAFLLNAPDQDASFLIEVVSGEDKDLGDLDYPMLPER